MADTFLLYWVYCLDELIMVRINKYTCIGCMLLPQDPLNFLMDVTPFDSISVNALFHMELIGEEDRTPHLPEPIF